MSWKRRISLFVVGLLLAFIIIEMVTRVVVGGGLIAKVYEDGFYEFEPNQHGWYNPRQPRARINNLGFRGEDIDRDNLNSSSRILFLGDSSTFGWAIEEDGIINRHFERVLEEKNISNVIVANAANGGYGIDHMIRAYERSVEKGYDPQVVIMIVWEGDFYRPLTPVWVPQMVGIDNIGIQLKNNFDLRRYSTGFSFLWFYVKAIYNNQVAKSLHTAQDGKPFTEENVKKLVEFHRRFEEKKITLLTVFFEYDRSSYSSQAEEVCTKSGFLCMTDTPMVISGLTYDQKRSRDGGHPSSLTNSLLAKSIYDAFRQEEVL